MTESSPALERFCYHLVSWTDRFRYADLMLLRILIGIYDIWNEFDKAQ